MPISSSTFPEIKRKKSLSKQKHKQTKVTSHRRQSNSKKNKKKNRLKFRQFCRSKEPTVWPKRRNRLISDPRQNAFRNWTGPPILNRKNLRIKKSRKYRADFLGRKRSEIRQRRKWRRIRIPWTSTFLRRRSKTTHSSKTFRRCSRWKRTICSKFDLRKIRYLNLFLNNLNNNNWQCILISHY